RVPADEPARRREPLRGKMLAEARQLRQSALELWDGDERAAPLVPVDDAAERELLKRLPHRRAADVEPALQLGLRRQHCPRLEPLTLDLVADRVRDLNVQRKPRPLLDFFSGERPHRQLVRTTVHAYAACRPRSNEKR